jgi:hypothetical protein
MDNNPITLTDSGALAAILHAVERETTVARLAPDGRSVQTGRATFITGTPGAQPERDWAAEAAASVRDLYLAVRPLTATGAVYLYWRIGQLIAEAPSGRFVADFDTDAFEAAGGQASVPASVAAWEAAHGVTGPVPPYGRAGGPSGQPENPGQLDRLTSAIYDITGTDLDTAEGLATEVLWIMNRMIAGSACAPLPDFAEGQAVEFRLPVATAPWEPGVFVRRVGDIAFIDGQGGLRYRTGMDRVRVPATDDRPSDQSEDPSPEPGSGKQGPFWTARQFGEPPAEFAGRMTREVAAGNLRDWPLEDLLILARAAGQVWRSAGQNDLYDELCDRQRELLDRAADSYLVAAPAPFERGDLAEYLTGPATAREWRPAVFDRYVEGSRVHMFVRPLTREGALGAPALSTRSETHRINPELISAARSWIADCEWANIGPDDIADLTHTDVIAGIQRHYQGGWAQFTADGAQLPPMKPDHQ